MLHTHPKVAQLGAYLIVLLLSTHLASSFPNINPTNQQQQQNYLSQLNKGFFQAPPQVEETIDEVQRILANDPTLPRLTRGEIEELYEKVTREEYEKSVEAGDMGRADSMRALMLVLPFNTDNNTEENLQELYTRPPVTKVVDSYTSHQPIKFLTPDPTALPKTTHDNWNQQVSATTFKPIYNLPARVAPSPTTYHPPPPAIMQQMATTAGLEQPYDQQAGSAIPYAYDYNPNPKLTQRFSSHYNAKNADFLRKPKTTTTSTVKPVADVLESLGIVGQTQSRHRYSAAQSDYYVAESAPRPVISSYSPSAADLQNFRGVQSLSPKIRPDAYTNFKPLNIGEELRVKPEVESYLTRFGIVGGRKRKELDKTASLRNSAVREQASAESEIATAKVPSASSSKERKGKPNSNAELMKLLENLQELERLNAKVKVSSTTVRPTTTKRTTTSTTTTTTSTTTTKAPTTSSDLLTHGTPLLIEPKKPRRRIDPNIDLAFANSGNQQATPTSTQQLAKLLANLQELEKLQINPDNVLKKSMTEQLLATTSTTAAPVRSPGRSPVLTNRFSELTAQPTARPQTDNEQLQQVLKQLQLLERQNVRASSTTTTTTTTTPRPQRANAVSGAVPPINDLQQLRMLLSNEAELQRLYEQARAGQKLTLTTRPPRTTTPRPTTTTTTTTTTTERPADSFDFNNLAQLQKYFAAMEQERRRTTTTSTTTTTTSTTTAAPPTTTATPARTVKKSNVDQAQLQELINRVHELERFNTRKDTSYEPVKPTDASFPILGFTTRNVKTQQVPKELPVNDFAHLQKLYKQVQEAEEASYGQVEISTAGTVSKIEHAQNAKRTQNFAQRIIDITNDTGSGSSLQAVDPDDFVQLQKLLRKVQELERVKIKTTANTDTQRRTTISGTAAPNLVTSASIRNQNVQHPNNAYVVYAERPKTFDNIAEIIQETDNLEDYKLDLPAYAATTPQPRPKQPASEQSTSQELHDLAYSRPANPLQSEAPHEKNKYQQLLSNLDDAERLSYSNMQPPIIQKTITKEPPRFIATRKPADLQKVKTLMSDKQMELKELQKLLNNAQELEKLGVTLPKELSMQIESKLMTAKPMSAVAAEQERLPTTTSSPYLYDAEEPREHTAVFSLTTQKSAAPRVTTSTSTESSVQLPVFSATKIIEAAIKRAANKIGVPTEATQAKGFQRRHASNEELDQAMAGDDMDDDLMGQFSELNYQLAALPENTRAQRSTEPTLQSNDKELQRLIANLQELQKLNINLTPEQVQTADSKYLETLKQQLSETEETKKGRRQSGSTTTTTTTMKPTTSTSSPTRLQLDLSLDDGDKATSAGDANAESASSASSTTTTTEESRNGSLTDLEESFGPNPVADMTTEAPKKKNGFYFLADWNSFLEVGDGDDQVVVRFSPKIGDPRIFLPVKIP